MEQFGLNLSKAGMSERLLDFFPPNKRDEESFARHFEAEDMKQLVTFQNKKQLFLRKETIVDQVKSLLEENKINEVKDRRSCRTRGSVRLLNKDFLTLHSPSPSLIFFPFHSVFPTSRQRSKIWV